MSDTGASSRNLSGISRPHSSRSSPTLRVVTLDLDPRHASKSERGKEGREGGSWSGRELVFLFDVRCSLYSRAAVVGRRSGESCQLGRMKKREIHLLSVEMERDRTFPWSARSQLHGDLVKPWTDLTAAHCGYFPPSFLSPRAHCHCQSGRCGTRRAQCQNVL